MYVPRHFQMPPEAALAVVRDARFGTLVTVADGLPHATPLPLLWREDGTDLGSLVMHVARPNDQWRHTGPGLVLVDGPDAYVSPHWYASFSESAPAVPTWNYATVQVRGEVVCHRDEEWLRRAVVDLTARHQERFDLDELDARYVTGQLRSIVGIELRITEVVGKLKLGQNRSVTDLHSAIEGLESEGSIEDDAAQVAQMMREVSLPHAQAREAEVQRARSRRRDA